MWRLILPSEAMAFSSDFPVTIQPQQGVDCVPHRPEEFWFVIPNPRCLAIPGFVKVGGEHDHTLPGRLRHQLLVVANIFKVLITDGVGDSGGNKRTNQRTIGVVFNDQVLLNQLNQLVCFRCLNLLTISLRYPAFFCVSTLTASGKINLPSRAPRKQETNMPAGGEQFFEPLEGPALPVGDPTETQVTKRHCASANTRVRSNSSSTRYPPSESTPLDRAFRTSIGEVFSRIASQNARL